MKCNAQITIWHNEGQEYSKMTFGQAYVKTVEKIDKSGIKQKGFFSQSECRVRIPTVETINAAVGDYLQIGDISREPDRTRDFKITAVSDNRWGSTPHYRLFCEK